MDVTLVEPTVTAGVEEGEEQPCWKKCGYRDDDSGDGFC